MCCFETAVHNSGRVGLLVAGILTGAVGSVASAPALTGHLTGPCSIHRCACQPGEPKLISPIRSKAAGVLLTMAVRIRGRTGLLVPSIPLGTVRSIVTEPAQTEHLTGLCSTPRGSAAPTGPQPHRCTCCMWAQCTHTCACNLRAARYRSLVASSRQRAPAARVFS